MSKPEILITTIRVCHGARRAQRVADLEAALTAAGARLQGAQSDELFVRTQLEAAQSEHAATVKVRGPPHTHTLSHSLSAFQLALSVSLAWHTCRPCNVWFAALLRALRSSPTYWRGL